MEKAKLEGVSHGRRYLLDLMEQRKLKSYADDTGLSFNYLYKIAAGIHKPPCAWIYLLRKDIYPGLWFTEEGNEEPERLYRIQESDGPEWPLARCVNLRKLQAIADGDNLHRWSKQQGLSYDSTYQLLKLRFPPGFKKITLLKKWFDPAGWFFTVEK
ncbi:MAG: hypothetical protein LBQ61_03835 [Spirochaetales bacterium]|nr:hypothetical protein [Spirochaetales bacterium]